MAYTDYEKTLVMNGVLKRYELQILDSSDTEIDLIGANRMDYESANLLKNLSSSDQKLEFGLALSSYFKCTFHNLASGLTENDYTNKKIIITQKFEYINDSDVEVTASELVATMFIYYVKSINKKSSQFELLAYDAIQFEQWEDINLGLFMNLPAAYRSDSNLFAFAMREKMGGLKNSGMTFSEDEITSVTSGYNFKVKRGYLSCNSADAYSHAMIILNLINQSDLNAYVPAGFKTGSPNFFKVRVQIFSDDNYTTMTDEYYMDTKQGLGQFPIGGSIKFMFRTYLYYIYLVGGTPTSFNKDLIDGYDTFLTKRTELSENYSMGITFCNKINIPPGTIMNQYEIINDICKSIGIILYVDRSGVYQTYDFSFLGGYEIVESEKIYYKKYNTPSETLLPSDGLLPLFENNLIRLVDTVNSEFYTDIGPFTKLIYNTNSERFFEPLVGTFSDPNDESKINSKNPLVEVSVPDVLEYNLIEIASNEFFDTCYDNGDNGDLTSIYNSLLMSKLQFLRYKAGEIESVAMPWLEPGEIISVDTYDGSFDILNVKSELKGISIAQRQIITSLAM